MEDLQFRLLSDEMLKTCRELIPVTRKMTETDENLVVDCFNKFNAAFMTAEEIMSRSNSLFGQFNFGGPNPPKGQS